jgi:hypothetical protein
MERYSKYETKYKIIKIITFVHNDPKDSESDNCPFDTHCI